MNTKKDVNKPEGLDVVLMVMENFMIFKKEQTAEEGAKAVISMLRKIYGIEE